MNNKELKVKTFKIKLSKEITILWVPTLQINCDVQGCNLKVNYFTVDLPIELNSNKFNSRVCEKHIENIGELSCKYYAIN